jgi:hypothetical protein
MASRFKSCLGRQCCRLCTSLRGRTWETLRTALSALRLPKGCTEPWIYKLGLALLVKDAEQLAHVRAQILDYASVCEGHLGDMVRHAIVSGHVNGAKHLLNSRGQELISGGVTAKLSKRYFTG